MNGVSGHYICFSSALYVTSFSEAHDLTTSQDELRSGLRKTLTNHVYLSVPHVELIFVDLVLHYYLYLISQTRGFVKMNEIGQPRIVRVSRIDSG